MSVATVRRVVCRMGPDYPLTDAELVAAIAPTGADREAAFVELLGRYGPMVLGVCRRVLGDLHDAEDAFQAAFLVLARKSGSIRPAGAVGGWLHGVAVRTARKAKTAADRRRRREMATAEATRVSEPASSSVENADLRAVIDAELAALPDLQRAAVVLCDLQGKTRAEAAAELNRPEGTVAAWLARGRKALAARLARRGVALPAAGLVAVATPAAVSAQSVSAAVATFLGHGVSVSVLALAEGVMKSLSSASTKLAAVVVAVGSLLVAVATATAWNAGDATPPVLDVPAAPIVAGTAPVPRPEPDVKAFLDHKGHIYSASYTADGKKFVSVGNGYAMVWDAETLKKLFTTDAEFAAFSGDGKLLFVLVKDRFRTLDATTGKEASSKPRDMPKALRGGRTAAFSRDGKMHVEFDGIAHHLRGDFKGDLPVLEDQDTNGDITSDIELVSGRGSAFSPEGSQFAGIHKRLKGGDTQGVLTIWNTAGKRIGTISRDLNHPVHAFAWSPDGKEIAVGYGDGVRVYDAKTRKEIRTLDPPRKWGDPPPDTSALAWSVDGRTIAAAVTEEVSKAFERPDGRTETKVVAIKVVVRLLDAQTGKELRRFEGFPDNLPVVSLAFSPDGKHLLSGAGFFPDDGPASNYPQPAKHAPALRVIPLGAPPANPPALGPVAWKERKILGLAGWISGSVAYSTDGKRLFVGGTNGIVRAYDTASWKQLWEYGALTNCPCVAVSPDGKSVAVTFKDADRRWGVRMVSAATGKLEHTLDEGGTPGVVGPEPYSVGFFPDVVLPDSGEPPLTSRKLIFGTAGGYVVKTWIDPEKASTITSRTVAAGKLPADYNAVPLAVDPEGKRVVVTGPIDKDTGKNVLWAWSAGSGVANKLLEGHKGTVVSAAWSKNGKVIVTGDDAGVVIVWDAATFKEKSRVTIGGRVAAVAVSPDGMGIAASAIRPSPKPLPGQAGCTGDVFIWLAAFPPKKPEPLSSTQTGSPFTGIASLAFAPDGKSLASTFANFTLLTRTGILVGQVRIFSVAPVAPPAPEKPVPPPVAVEQKWTDTSVLTDHGRLVNGVAVAPDGQSFAAATDGNVTCWDAKTRKKLWQHKPTDSAVFALAYSPDGKHLCIATKIDVTRLDAKTGKPDPWTGDEAIWFGKVDALAYHPNGERLAASDGYVTRVRRFGGKGEEITIGAPPKESEPAPEKPAGLAWSKDGKWLALIQPQQEGKKWPVTLWEVDSKAKNTKLLTGHDNPVTAVAWSKDGKMIASGDEKGTVILWDAATGKELWRKKFTGRDETDGRINALAFSPADNTLATAISLGSGKQPERVMLLAAKDGEVVGQVMRAWWIPVSSVAWAKDGKRLVTGCGTAGRAIAQTEPAVGEVVVWERKP